ncbi:MAG: hypothetical protein U0441_11590 [Polyangiaceae bacterium]
MSVLGRRWIAWGLVLGVAACGPAEGPKTPTNGLSCGGAKKAACERDIAKSAAEGRNDERLLSEYIAARASENEGDPWVLVARELADGRGAKVAIVDARGPSASAAPEGVTVTKPGEKEAPEGAARVVVSAALPDPSASLGAQDLLLALGVRGQYEHVIWIGADRSYEMYPRDPLGPLMLGVRPAVRDDAEAKSIAKNIALAVTVRRALAAAGDFRYPDAAKEVAAITAQIDGRDPFEEPVLRARYARNLLWSAGISLDAPQSFFGSDAEDAKSWRLPPVPAPSEADSPYGDLLRIRVTDDSAAEWKRRGAKVSAQIAEDRRDLAASYFAPTTTCGAVTLPPAFDRTADMTFAGLLPGSLAGARIEAISSADPDPGLPLSAWYPRYEALVDLVERTRFAWLETSLLVRQRGEIAGISPRGTPTYRRVTDLGLRHIRALRELADAAQERYPGRAELGLAYSGGLLTDDRLRDALIELTDITTKARLARASDPESITGSLLIAVLAGMTYPPAIQSAHYLALQSAFAAKIKGDLATQTGWGAAGLFALDAVFRLITDQGPNLAFSSEQVARALGDPKIALPNVATVVSALARYAALAKDKPLAALAKPAQFTPERAAAREALRKAILDMGAPGEAPATVADDLTTLADGLIATASVVLHKKAPPPGTCADTSPTAADIEVSHALTKLAEVRQKIREAPSFKGKDGLWARRARLLVALLSDAMDFAAPVKPGATRKLTFSAAEVDAALTGALREWDEPGARDAIVGTYSVLRFFLAKDPKATFEGAGPYVFRALGGIGRFLRGSGPNAEATLLDAIAGAPSTSLGGEDLLSALVSFSKAAYDKGQNDQGDVLLLGTLLLTATGKRLPPKAALELAAQHKSRVEWALAMFGEAFAARSAGNPNVQAYAAGARKMATDLCAVGRVDDVTAVMGAVNDFAAGKRKEARSALSTMLARADLEGLVVPKISYQYSEKHDKKIFSLSFGLTFGAGLVEGGNTFQIGLGVTSASDRSAKLNVTAASPEETAPETARFYLRTSALAAAYDFLDGDAASAAIDARRAVTAIISGVRLGSRSLTIERNKWADEARALIALDAQLAADAGLPFLAGDLWTLVRDSLPADAADAAVDEMLTPPIVGLTGVKDADAPLERARKSLRIVAAPLACTGAKVDVASFEVPACDRYSLAVALRIADVVKKLPRLKKGPETAQSSCAPLAALDAFFAAADHGAYDPDAFTKAVESLRADGRVDEAATLLARQRREGHCSPALLTTARALGRSPSLLPAARADMLAVAVNCAGADGGAELQKDLLAIDQDTRKLADPTRNLRLLLFVGQLALRADKPELLLPLVRADGFIERYLRLSGNATVGALVLHHAAHILTGEAFDPKTTQGAFSLICESFPSDERRSECADLKGMRDTTTAADKRKALAKAALERILTRTEDAPAKKP